jgi:TPR repeat protein
MKKKSLFLLMILGSLWFSTTLNAQETKKLFVHAYAHLDDGKTWMFTPVFTITIDKSFDCGRIQIDIQAQFYNYLKEAGYKISPNAVTKNCSSTSYNENEDYVRSTMADFKARGNTVHRMIYFSYRHGGSPSTYSTKTSSSGSSSGSSSSSRSSSSSSGSSASSTTPTLSQADLIAVQRAQRSKEEVISELVSEGTNSIVTLAASIRQARLEKQQREQRIQESSLRRQAAEAKRRSEGQERIDEYLPKAEKGDVYAMEEVAGNYSWFMNDEEKAMYWYMKAANAGSVYACYKVIEKLEKKDRDGDRVATAESLKWIPKLIELGDFNYAMLKISMSYGARGKKWYDADKAMEFYKEMASKGSTEAMFTLGELLTGGNEYSLKGKKKLNLTEGLGWLKLCSEMEDSYYSVKAVKELAEIYETGRLVPKDKAKAAEYNEAAKKLQQKLGYTFYMFAVITSEISNKVVVTDIVTCHGGTGYGDEFRGARKKYQELVEKQFKQNYASYDRLDVKIWDVQLGMTEDFNNISNTRASFIRAYTSQGKELIFGNTNFEYDLRSK